MNFIAHKLHLYNHKARRTFLYSSSLHRDIEENVVWFCANNQDTLAHKKRENNLRSREWDTLPCSRLQAQ